MTRLAISVYEDESISFHVDIDPELWSSSQRLVSNDELERIKALLASQAELQEFLKEIKARPEWDAISQKEMEI